MSKEEAKAEVLKRWRAQPQAERETRDQAAEFALKLALAGITFDGCPNPYHQIKGWLQQELRGR